MIRVRPYPTSTPMAITISSALVLMGVAAARADDPARDARRYWPAWRGPLATGEAPQADPPAEWSETRNVRWKAELPGFGHATPAVWGDRVYVLTAQKTGRSAASAPAVPEPQEAESEGRRGRRRPARPTEVYAYKAIALERTTGRIVWERTVTEDVPHEGAHQDASPASPSPIVDGSHVIAPFGSRGVYCLDLDGRVVWSKDLGDLRIANQFGEGSSPALHGDVLVVVWDHEGDDFIVALDKNSGAELWRRERDEPTSWATPLIVESGGRAQVVVSGTNRVRAYDLRSGELVWSCPGLTRNVIPSPVHADGVVYVMSGFRGAAAKAVRLSEARGELSGPPAIVWTYEKNTPYVPSPLVYDGRLYFLENNRLVVSCLDARDGTVLFGPQRIEGISGAYASLVGAAGRVYIVGRDGKTAVLRSGSTFELLGVNELDDGFDASPAIAGDELYLRGHSRLYCIAR